MSRSMTRRVALMAMAFVCLSLTSCQSKNTGIIVGKWKVTSSSKSEVAQLNTMGMAIYFDFRSDGVCDVGLMSASSGPNLAVATADAEFKKTAGKTTYTLGSGERVNFESTGTMFKGGKARTNVAISGDNMTMTDPDGTTMQLVKVK